MMSGKPNIYRKAISHTAIYGAADILRRFVGFFMLPVYTRYLTPEDYGIVQLLLVAVGVMEIFLGMRMGQAIFRYYSLADTEYEKKQVMSTAFIVTFIATTVAFLVLFFNSELAARVALGSNQNTHVMQVFSIILVAQALEDYGLIYIRVHQRPYLFFAVSILKLILQVFLNVYLIVYLKMAVEGVVYSAVISTVVTAIFASIYTYMHSGITFSKLLAKKMIMFSLPLWLSALGTLYLNSADKYFLRVFSGLNEVGLYALAGKFGFLILIFVWDPFSNVWQAMRYEIYKMPNAHQVYKRIFILLMFALSFVGLGISLFADVAIKIMADKAFWPASPAVPLLVASSIAMALTYFNNLGILLHEKTSIIAKGTYLNAVVLTVCFIVLIKFFGFIGAAVSFLIGSVSQLLWIESGSRKLYDMKLPWNRAIVISITWLACYFISYLLPSSLLVAILGKILIMVVFVGLVFILPILDSDEKQQIYIYFQRFKNKIVSRLM
ncbi:MAG: oligosaccharide flippase family protein [Gammaproteobacteria bacterium]|nr:oligosaccharide flippase family protein [Gammaproteobacteria bacterium]